MPKCCYYEKETAAPDLEEIPRARAKRRGGRKYTMKYVCTTGTCPTFEESADGTEWKLKAQWPVGDCDDCRGSVDRVSPPSGFTEEDFPDMAEEIKKWVEMMWDSLYPETPSPFAK